MAWLEDALDEFKKAKPPEKIAIVDISLAVVGIGLYVHHKNASSSSADQTASGESGLYGAAGSLQSSTATSPNPGGGSPTPGTPNPPGGTTQPPVPNTKFPPKKNPKQKPPTKKPPKKTTTKVVSTPTFYSGGTQVTKVASQSAAKKAQPQPGQKTIHPFQ